MRWLNSFTNLLRRHKPSAEQKPAAAIAAFAKELQAARHAELQEREVNLLIETAWFNAHPEDSLWIKFAETRGYPVTVLGPFRNEEEIIQYAAIKRSQQRSDAQEFWATHPDARPRHDGDLFVMPDSQLEVLSKAEAAPFILAGIADRFNGRGFDRNLWEKETYDALGYDNSGSDVRGPLVDGGVHQTDTPLRDLALGGDRGFVATVHSSGEVWGEGTLGPAAAGDDDPAGDRPAPRAG